MAFSDERFKAIPPPADPRLPVREYRVTSVSVAMATYNGSRFVKAQLESIAGQTHLPSQLVVTDDGSSDDTLDIVKQFSLTAPFPVTVHKNATRLGYRANFMLCTSMCISEVIALCDQDDIWLPDKLETAVAVFSEPSVLLCHHEAWLLDSAGLRLDLAALYTLEDLAPPLSLFPMRNPFGFSMLFRRELLNFSDQWVRSVDNLSDDCMAHDQWFFFLASTFGATYYISKPLAEYRQHEHSTYGAPYSSTRFFNRFGAWVRRAADEYASFSRAAEARASILSELETRLDTKQLLLAHAAINGYRDLARNCAHRSVIYSRAQLSARLQAWHQALKGGAYDSRRLWSFGRKAAVKDYVFASLPPGIRNLLPTS